MHVNRNCNQSSVGIGNVKISSVKGDHCAKISKINSSSARCAITLESLRCIHPWQYDNYLHTRQVEEEPEIMSARSSSRDSSAMRSWLQLRGDAMTLSRADVSAMSRRIWKEPEISCTLKLSLRRLNCHCVSALQARHDITRPATFAFVLGRGRTITSRPSDPTTPLQKKSKQTLPIRYR